MYTIDQATATKVQDLQTLPRDNNTNLSIIGIPRGITERRHEYWENSSHHPDAPFGVEWQPGKNYGLAKLTSFSLIDLMLQDYKTGQIVYSRIEPLENQGRALALLKTANRLNQDVVLVNGIYRPDEKKFEAPEAISHPSQYVRMHPERVQAKFGIDICLKEAA